jgi:hypothetical protein
MFLETLQTIITTIDQFEPTLLIDRKKKGKEAQITSCKEYFENCNK